MESPSVVSFVASVENVGLVEVFCVITGEESDNRIDARVILAISAENKELVAAEPEKLRRIPSSGEILSVPTAALRVIHPGVMVDGKRSRVVILAKDGVMFQAADQTRGNTRAIPATIVDIGSSPELERVREVLISRWGLKPLSERDE